MRKSSGEINSFDKRMGFHVNDSLNSRTIPHSILISSNLFTCAILYYTAINHNSLLTFVSPHQPCNWTRIEVKWASGKKSIDFIQHDGGALSLLLACYCHLSSSALSIRKVWNYLSHTGRGTKTKTGNKWKCAKRRVGISDYYQSAEYHQFPKIYSWFELTNWISLKIALVKLLI